MSALKDRLQADLTTAIKTRDELRAATIRMALAAIREAEVAGKQAKVLADDEVTTVLAREAKKRREAADAFAGAGRAELAERERAEGAVLADYLPRQLDDAELAEIVDRVLAAQDLAGPQAMGPAMKAVNAEVAGRADGKRVSTLVRERLNAG